jgi:hypothetical protein
LDVHYTASSDVTDVRPIDASIVDAFPELAPYVGNPSAVILTLNGNHNKDNPNSVQWVAEGSLRKVNYVEVRCAYLAFVNESLPFPQPQKCLGCHWFLGRKD